MVSKGALWEGNNIPTDLVFEILLRLPAKAIVRCLLTCKTWYSLIKSSHFISFHLGHHKIQDQRLLILKEGSFTVFLESGVTLIEQESARIPFPVVGWHLYILGSCSGLVLVRLRVDRGWLVFLWNPAIGKVKVIDTIFLGMSDEDVIDESCCLYAFALAFHEPSSDYRVVRIANAPENQLLEEVDVYSLSGDSWHQVSGIMTDRTMIPTIADTSEMAYYIEGVVHWIAYNKVEELVHFMILSFDFDSEVFKVIDFPTPHSTELAWSYDLELKEFDGKLALFVGDPWDPALNAWLMMKYPVVESWTNRDCLFAYHDKLVIRPLVCTRSGNCVCRPHVKWAKLFYFNALEDNLYDLGVLTPYKTPVIVDYTESLVLLDCGNAVLDLNP